jgi:hypothetical protein
MYPPHKKFITSFETYEKNLDRWALRTTLEPAKQALLQVHMLDGDPPGINEKIDGILSDDNLKSTSGIAKILEVFESIYEKDSLSLKKKGKQYPRIHSRMDHSLQ